MIAGYRFAGFVGVVNCRSLESVDEVCGISRDQIATLFARLDLDRDGLMPVKEAVARQDMQTACDALITYYRGREVPSRLRIPKVAGGEARHPRGDQVLQDIFSVQGVTAPHVRQWHGGLNWTYMGPKDDREWAWFINRHVMFRDLVSAYRETGNPDYVRKFDDLVRDWVCAIPYQSEEEAVLHWRPLEAAARLGSTWPRAFFGFQQEDAFSPAGGLLMLASIRDHANHLRHFHETRGNHRILEMMGLLRGALYWPEFRDSADWVEYASDQLSDQIAQQVYPDGACKELSGDYHRVVLGTFQRAADTFERNRVAVPADFRAALIRMWNYLAYTMRPNGFGLLNNDGDLSNVVKRLKRAAALYRRDDWLYIATNGRRGRGSDPTPSVFFPWAGQLVSRSDFGADAHWSFFDVGPWGTSHQHNDKLHLSVSAHGRDLLVDSGRFAYGGELGKRFRFAYGKHSAGHNVVLIDGKGQAAGPLEAARPLAASDYGIQDRFDFARGSQDHFDNVEGEVRHLRSVVYVRGGFWVVVDRVETDRPRDLQVLWHWHPSVDVVIQDGRVASVDAEQGNLAIVPVGELEWTVELAKGQDEPRLQGWYSERYNQAVPSFATLYDTTIEQSATFVWVLMPAKGRVPDIEAKAVSSTDDHLALAVVDADDVKYDIRVPLTGGSEPVLRASDGRIGQMARVAADDSRHPVRERAVVCCLGTCVQKCKDPGSLGWAEGRPLIRRGVSSGSATGELSTPSLGDRQHR